MAELERGMRRKKIQLGFVFGDINDGIVGLPSGDK